MSLAPGATPRANDSELRRRVAPLCHIIRVSAVIWIVWASVVAVSLFASRAQVAEHYGRFLNVDLAGLPTPGYLLALAILLTDLGIAWLPVIFLWRLFGHYLRGDIFSLAAVGEMRLCGWTGVAAVITDIVSRPPLAYALTRHLPEAERHHFWTSPNDILFLLMALFIVALAHIFRAGVEIADDNRQIV
jgi:hypothetical protein